MIRAVALSSLLAFWAMLNLGSVVAFVCNDDFDCQPHGSCSNNQACVCDQGYYGDACDRDCPLQCQNSADCIEIDNHGGFSNENDFYCQCPPGFSGGLCQNRDQAEEASPGSTTSQRPTIGKTVGIVIGSIVCVGLITVLLAFAINKKRQGKKGTIKNGTEQNGPEVVMSGPEEKELPPIE